MIIGYTWKIVTILIYSKHNKKYYSSETKIMIFDTVLSIKYMLIAAHGNQYGRLHNAHLKLEDSGLLIYDTMLLHYWFPSFQSTTMSSS